MRRLVSIVAIACAALGGGCATGSGSEVFVELRTDFSPGVEFVTVRTEFSSRPLSEAGSAPQSMQVSASSADDFVDGRQVAEITGLSADTLHVRVTLLSAGGDEVATRRAVVRVQDDLVVTLVIARSCLGVVCDGSQVCEGGRCVDERCTSQTPEHCGAPLCSAATDCAGAVECSEPRCVDGVCLDVPSDARCEASDRCDPWLGCVAREGGSDGGASSSMDGGPGPSGMDAGTPPRDAGPAWPCDEVERIAGDTRYHTAVAFSQRFFPSGSTRVIIAKSASPGVTAPDAILAAPLARRSDAPLLLTDGSSLTAETSAEIDRLAPTFAYLLGGTAAISTDVEQSLTSRGITAVRYAGATRAETATDIARIVGTTSSGRVFVANGFEGDLVEALLAAGAGAALSAPVLFVQRDEVPSATDTFLRDEDVRQIYVVGSTASVSEATLSALSSHAPVTRLAGATRAGTATAIAAELVGEAPADEVVLVHQLKLTDAMAAAAAAQTYLLFADDSVIPEPTEAFLAAYVGRAFVAGGESVLSVDVERRACEILSAP